jgi:hypothetical protein
MHIPTLRLPALHLLAEPILQAALAAATIGAAALLLGRRAELRLQQVRIPIDTPRPRRTPRRK